MANTMNCVIISKKEDELYNIRVGIIFAQRKALAMKRPVPLYDFTAFGKAIKAARMAKGESRKLLAEYKTARSEAREYETVKQNVDTLLSVPKEDEPKRTHHIE